MTRPEELERLDRETERRLARDDFLKRHPEYRRAPTPAITEEQRRAAELERTEETP